MDNLSIVGIFYDGYIDLWRDFFGILKHNWPDCPYKIYIVDNELDLTDDDKNGLDVTVIKAGKDAEYSKKVQTALEYIQSEYMLLLLEDFYFASKVENKKLEEIIDIIRQNNIDYYSMPMPEFIGHKEPERYKSYDLRKISVSREYVFSCQPSIWKREFLQLCIGDMNYNAWIFEGIYAKSDCVRREDFLSDCVVDYSNPLNLRHGAIQGNMVQETVKAIKASGYSMTTQRKMLPFSLILKQKIKILGHRLLVFPGMSILKKVFKKESVLGRYDKEINEFAPLTINSAKIDAYLKNKLR